MSVTNHCHKWPNEWRRNGVIYAWCGNSFLRAWEFNPNISNENAPLSSLTKHPQPELNSATDLPVLMSFSIIYHFHQIIMIVRNWCYTSHFLTAQISNHRFSGITCVRVLAAFLVGKWDIIIFIQTRGTGRTSLTSITYQWARN